MIRSLRSVPASILAVLLLVCSVGVSRDAGSEPSAWGALSVSDTHPSLHASDSVPRVDVRHHRRTVAQVAVPLFSATAYRLGAPGVIQPTTFTHVAQRADQCADVRGYDATAPPHTLS
jgi:hypothetical protein